MSALLDALGFAGDVLGTPGSVVRGLLSGQPGRAFGGILDPSQRVSGAELIGAEEGSLSGLGADLFTDPLTLIPGASLLSGLGKGAKAASGLSRMLPLRRNFSMVKGVDSTGDFAKVTGRPAHVADAYEVSEGMAKSGDALGTYIPEMDMGGIAQYAYTQAPRNTQRHEIMHGLVDQAAKAGRVGDLPLIARPAGYLGQMVNKGQGGNFVRGLSSVADEVAAHALEARTLPGQLRNLGNFLVEHPWNYNSRAGYARQFAQDSPLISALYRGSGFLPYAGAGAAAGAGLAASGY